jgi:hypothetical protein
VRPALPVVNILLGNQLEATLAAGVSDLDEAVAGCALRAWP